MSHVINTFGDCAGEALGILRGEISKTAVNIPPTQFLKDFNRIFFGIE
jgi:hypothetical protein